MHSAHEFIQALALVLGTAAATTVVFHRLRQPVVLGYIAAGLLVGPHVAFPLFADVATIQTLSELGVILLMFSLGLEFSLRKLVRLGPTAGLTAVIQCSIMIWLGFAVGRAFGWTPLESFFTGALIAISSTTIIAKAFDEQGIKGRVRELVVGILIVEDLIAVLLMAALTAVASGAGLSARELAITTGRLVAFLVGLVAVGLLVVPRMVRAIVRLQRTETTLVASIGICFGIALLAHAFGYSVALGAFIAGSLVAESGAEKEIEHLVQPVRDVFAAIFFVSVGMLIDPALVLKHWVAVLVLVGVVIAGKIFSVSVGAFLTGNGTRVSIQSGMSLAQIGEFSFIIAGLGLSLKATGEFLYPVAVAVSAVTTLTTPWLIRASGPFASWVDRQLPRPLQTFVSLYGTWIERLRETPRRATLAATVRRRVLFLVGDAALLVAIIIGVSLAMPALSGALEAHAGIGPTTAKAIVVVGAAALCVPFLFGIVQLARGLGLLLAQAVFPPRADGRLDLAAAPRKALLVSIQLAIVLIVGLPLLAITQPFVRGFYTGSVVVGALAVLLVVFWRTATNLEGHVRAGAQMVVEALARQARSHAASPETAPLLPVESLLPGLGKPVSVKLTGASPAVGKTLASINLRGVTGATVLAIQRGETGISVPTAHDVLKDGDILALAGTHEAIEAAKRLLTGSAAS